MLPDITRPKKDIYLDHAAATPLDARVKKAMEPFWMDVFGNPSALYKKGREAAYALSQARRTIASAISAKPEEIIFTAGGTESINLALFGTARKFKDGGLGGRHIIASSIEHSAVLQALEGLKGEGCEVTLAEVDGEGFVSLDELKKAVRPETSLISIMYANNEIGTIQPIAEIGSWLKGLNAERQRKGLQKIYFHTDACQAAGIMDMDVNRLGVDLLSANGSKIYGPKQTGFLYARSGLALKPLIYGGGQEKNLRGGTENVPGFVGLAEALKIAQNGRARESKRLAKLRDYFISKLQNKIAEAVLNGPDERGRAAGSKRLPGNVNVSILGVEGESLLLYLDSYGVCASTGSACTSLSLEPSHVLLAIGRPYEHAHGSIRFTFGRTTEKKDLDYVLKVLPGVVGELRRISGIDITPGRNLNIERNKAFVGQKTDKFRPASRGAGKAK